MDRTTWQSTWTPPLRSHYHVILEIGKKITCPQGLKMGTMGFTSCRPTTTLLNSLWFLYELEFIYTYFNWAATMPSQPSATPSMSGGAWARSPASWTQPAKSQATWATSPPLNVKSHPPPPQCQGLPGLGHQLAKSRATWATSPPLKVK
jgi:hypothetical protein